MKPFDYLVADDFDAAVAEYGEGQATLKAGGIDLLDLMKERITTPQTVLSIDRLQALRYIQEKQDGIHIGCLTTLADLGRSKLLAAKYTVLHNAAVHAATPQIRERASVGGNLCQRPRCWFFRNRELHCLKKRGPTCYAAEGENRYHAIFGGGPCHIVHPSNIAPAIVALDGSITIHSSQGEEQRIKAADFFVLPEASLHSENVLQPGQIVTKIVLPMAPSESATIELREKQSSDWPLVTASVARLQGSWRVCLGAVAPIPWPSQPAMEVLGNQELTPELAAKAGEAAAQDAVPLEENEYKVQLVKVAVKRALLSAAGMEVPTWD